MLTENRNCAESNFGVKRKVSSNYRGQTEEEFEQFLRDQRMHSKEQEVNGAQLIADRKSVIMIIMEIFNRQK